MSAGAAWMPTREKQAAVAVLEDTRGEHIEPSIEALRVLRDSSLPGTHRYRQLDRAIEHLDEARHYVDEALSGLRGA